MNSDFEDETAEFAWITRLGAPLPPSRSGGTPGDPRRPAVTSSAEPLRAARAVRRRAMGPHVRDGRSARLRAAGRDQRCRDRAREGRSPDEVAYDYLTGDAGHFL